MVTYLASTNEFRIGGALREGEDVFKVYTDSDHAGDRVLTKRSQTGVGDDERGVGYVEECTAAEHFDK